MECGLVRLGNFLEHAKLPVSVQAAATVSGISVEEVEGILKGNKFIVLHGKIYPAENNDVFLLYLQNANINWVNAFYKSTGVVLLCEDGKVTDYDVEWRRVG